MSRVSRDSAYESFVGNDEVFELIPYDLMGPRPSILVYLVDSTGHKVTRFDMCISNSMLSALRTRVRFWAAPGRSRCSRKLARARRSTAS